MLRSFLTITLALAGIFLTLTGCAPATSPASSTTTTTTTTDNTGTPAWATTVSSGTGESYFYATATDGSGNVYAAGHIVDVDAYDFGNGVTAAGAYGGANAVVVKYNASGTAQWAKTVSSGTGESHFYATATDGSGNVYAAGYIYFTDTYDFGNGVTATGGASYNNVVLVKYNSSGTAQWAQTVPGGSNAEFLAVTVDGSGNVYAAGYIDGSSAYDFGNSVTAAGINASGNTVLVKYNSSGTAQWAKTVSSGSSYSQFSAVAADSSGNVYAVGYIDGSSTFGFGNNVTVAGAYSASFNLVLVKYNASGTAQWARSVSTGNLQSAFQGVTTDSSGNVYAAGLIQGTDAYGLGNGVTATGGASSNNVVLVKYNSSGTAQWAKTVSSASSKSVFRSVAADGLGNIYAAGYIRGTGTFGFGNSITATGTSLVQNPVVVKYNSSGTAQWAQTVSSGSSGSEVAGVTVDSSGNLFGAGYIQGTAAYGFGDSVTVTAPYSSTNSLLVKYQ